MKPHHISCLAAIAALGLTTLPASTVAQQATFKEQHAKPVPFGLDADEDWKLDVTVLTMALSGAWGVATEERIAPAIAGAIRNCKTMSGTEAVTGCGAHFTNIRAGWSLGIRCGDNNIVVAAKTLADAERQADQRETELRTHHVPDMPSCARVVTVNPHGMVVKPAVGYSSASR